MVERSLAPARTRRPRARRRSIVLVLLASLAAVVLYVLPGAWQAWALRPVRSLAPGDARAVALERLGPPDVRLPLHVDGLTECWTYFWPKGPVRSLCKRLPWKPRTSAFSSSERPEAMVQLYWNADGTLRAAAVEAADER